MVLSVDSCMCCCDGVDIFWVFGTDVMVTVAMSIKGPVMLKFPKVLPSLENDYKVLCECLFLLLCD